MKDSYISNILCILDQPFNDQSNQFIGNIELPQQESISANSLTTECYLLLLAQSDQNIIR